MDQDHYFMQEDYSKMTNANQTNKNIAESEANCDKETEESNEYLSSYNYFVYYHSLKPKDPKLPKPTYKPAKDQDIFNPNENKLKEEPEHLDENQHNFMGNNMDSINSLMANLNIQDKTKNDGLFDTNFLNTQKNDFLMNQPDGLNPWKTDVDINDNFDPLGSDLLLNQNFNNMNYMGVNMNDPNNFNNNMQNENQISLNGFYGMPPMNNADFNSNIKKSKKMPKNNNNFNQPPVINGNMGMMMNPNFNQNEYQNLGGFQAPNIYNLYYNNPNQQINNFRNNQMPMMGANYGNFIGNFNMMGMDFNNLALNNNMNNQFNQNKMNNINMNNIPKNNQNMHKPKKQAKNNDSNSHKKDETESLSFDDIVKNAVDLAKDHAGSRLLQKKYDEGNFEEREKIFEKLKPEVLVLSKDVFGNYVIQKILEFKNEENNLFILNSLQGKIYDLSLHMYGCRVIQQLISVISDEFIPKISEELTPYLAKCIEDQNGNHVIQKLIERLTPDKLNDLIDVAVKNMYSLSVHQYGCRVIQKLFCQCDEEQKNELLENIYKTIIELCQDQYGNYVIQYILEKQKGVKVEPIYATIKGQVFDMSTHKFASNVIEKALTYGNSEQRLNIINEIISKDDLVHDSLLSMVKDKYGNYVVQKMIEYSTQSTKENIIKRIISSQSLKKRDGFSKHVINFIEKIGFCANLKSKNPGTGDIPDKI